MMTGTFDLGRVTGFSAYEVWKAQPGNENKTEQDFLKFISSGGDWIDFDTTPIDFDSVRTYRTYGSTANLDTDLTRGSVPGDALSAEFSGGTFMFESRSCRNNLKKSTEYDTLQTMILFSGSANNPDEFAKYVRYGIFDEDDQTFTVQADWTMSNLFIDNEHIVSKAWKLAKTFNLKIAGVTKPVDGSQNVEFTKEELGLSEGGSSANEYYFEQIFEGYVPKTTLKIKDDIKDGLVFLVQLAPRVKYKMHNNAGGWASGLGNFPYVNRYRYFQPSASPNSDIGMNSLNLADYSLCFLLTSVPMNKETTQSNAYVSASQSNAYGYTATEKVEFLHTKQRVEQLLHDGKSAYPKGNSVVLTLLGWENLTDGGFYVTIKSISDFGYTDTEPYITRIWKLTKK